MTYKFELFPERLQRLRERKRISRVVLSELCGLQSDQIRKYERGERLPSVSSLVKLSEFFEVPIDYLIGGDCNACKGYIGK